MKQSLIALAIIAACGGAFAQSNSTSNSNATSSPTISSGNSGAESASSSQSNPNNANQQFIQLNTVTPETQRVQQDIHYSGSQKVKNVPGIAMSGPASGPCTGTSGGLGVAGPGFGVGGNFAKVDDGCTVRENTRTLGQVYQALDGADPMKAEAKAALMEGMAGLRAMNAKIIGEYQPPAPAPAAAAPAPVVAAAAPAKVGTGKCAGLTDPIVLASSRCK